MLTPSNSSSRAVADRKVLLGNPRAAATASVAKSDFDRDALGGEDDVVSAQERIKRLREQQKQHLEEAVRISHRTVETGHETTGELMRQGETIDRTGKSVDKIEYELKVSDKIVKSMSGLTGLVASWFTRNPKMEKSKKDSGGIGEVPKSGYADDSSANASPSTKCEASSRAHHSSDYRPSSSVDDDADRLLDELQGNLAVMRDQSVNQQALLQEQHRKLDTLITKMDKTNAHMKTTQRNMKKVT